MHNIVYLPIAEDDILAAVEYIANKLDNLKAAAELLDEIDKVADNLSRFPYASEPYYTSRSMRDEIRMVSVKNYIMYFTAAEDKVEIRRFLHGRRDRRNIVSEQ